jgi:hypothetical protein
VRPWQRRKSAYFTNASRSGAVAYNRFPFAIRVLESPTNNMPIGMASQCGRTEIGFTAWKLRVHGVDVPGQWVIVDGAFVPAE